MVYKRRIILPTQQADCVYRQKEIAGAGYNVTLQRMQMRLSETQKKRATYINNARTYCRSGSERAAFLKRQRYLRCLQGTPERALITAQIKNVVGWT